MVHFSSRTRSTQAEIMDNFNLQGTEMQQVLTDLKTVNKWLGGNAITLNGISQLLKKVPKSGVITIVDIGCGDGEILRQCARFGKKKGYNFKLIGVDANSYILSEARERSKEYPNITFEQIDVFSEENFTLSYDIALCTLFLHHFKNEDIITLLNQTIKYATIGIVVNDLQRSRLAFNLFKIAGRVLLKTKIARHDGLVSIARGFTKAELTEMSKSIKANKKSICWKWAFRYQWILK